MRSQAAAEIEGLLFLISLSTECFFLHRVAIVSDFCASLAAGYQDFFINPDDFMMCARADLVLHSICHHTLHAKEAVIILCS